jgi:diaminopimelate epimerase
VPYLPRRLPFVKMNGLGNDFIVVDVRSEPSWEMLLADPAAVRRLCERHRGIGADGILAILEPETVLAVATMRVHNADGSRAEMCGNGLRCVARFLFERDAPRPSSRLPELVIDTGAGPLCCVLALSEPDVVGSIEVDLGGPNVSALGQVALVVGPEMAAIELALVSMGNPHAVRFCDEADSYESLVELARRLGPQIERHPFFAHRTNVEFVRVRDQSGSGLEVVVWERGCGITQACGTGACAAMVAACRRGMMPFDRRCEVRLPGGVLEVTVAPDLSAVRMRGPAETVFFGEYETSSIMAPDGAAK